MNRQIVVDEELYDRTINIMSDPAPKTGTI
jgi:hypothetical protein